jgi:hypothetical protein
MRIRILRKPATASIDGLRLDGFEMGRTYDVGNSVGGLLLAEGWAEPVPFEESVDPNPRADRLPTAATRPFDRSATHPMNPPSPPNLSRDTRRPYSDVLPPAAADFPRRKR